MTENSGMENAFYDLICTDCRVRFDGASTEQFDQHSCSLMRRGYYKKSKSCNKCHKIFSTLIELRKHSSAHHSMVLYGCNFCEKSFPKLCLLNDHVNEHIGCKPHKCEKCGNGFSSSAKLFYHKRFSHQEFMIQCPECDLRFATAQMLGNHQRRHHQLESRTLKCEECEKTFANTSCLSQHRKTHRKKAYECVVCLKKFSRDFTMKRHIEQIHYKQ